MRTFILCFIAIFLLGSRVSFKLSFPFPLLLTQKYHRSLFNSVRNQESVFPPLIPSLPKEVCLFLGPESRG